MYLETKKLLSRYKIRIYRIYSPPRAFMMRKF